MCDTAKQTEIIFLWDGENWNPNGDMLTNNAPRYDEVSQKALATDVRIKRTIRDDLDKRKGEEIFVKETKAENGGINDAISRVNSFRNDDEDIQLTMIKKCIDVRAFGGVFPAEKKSKKNKNENEEEKDSKNKSFNLTGPFQFRMSKSLHQINEPIFIKGTGAFASGKGKDNKTFREEYILPYAMFATYGIVSAKSAEITHFTDGDLNKILDSLWTGTKNLITRSKIGQMPRFLLKITYKNPGHFIGDLDNRLNINLINTGSENEIRSINNFQIDFSKLKEVLENNKQVIEKIEYKKDSDFKVEIDSNWTELNIGN